MNLKGISFFTSILNLGYFINLSYWVIKVNEQLRNKDQMSMAI